MFKRILGIIATLAIVGVVVMVILERRSVPAVVETEDIIMGLVGYDTIPVSELDTIPQPASAEMPADTTGETVE